MAPISALTTGQEDRSAGGNNNLCGHRDRDVDLRAAREGEEIPEKEKKGWRRY